MIALSKTIVVLILVVWVKVDNIGKSSNKKKIEVNSSNIVVIRLQRR